MGSLTAAEIAAYIGAAAWLPQVASWVYRRAIRPKVLIVPERKVEIGYTIFGPIFNVRLSLSAERKDAIIDSIEAVVSHEGGDSHTLSWTGLRETFSEITDAAGNRQQLVEKDSPAIALKVTTELLVEKFVRFQDLAYHEEHRAVLNAMDQQYNFIRTNPTQDRDGVLSSREFYDAVEFYREAFWWRPGRYCVTFAIKSRNHARLVAEQHVFALMQADVDTLQSNVSIVPAWYENIVKADIPGYERRPMIWQWRNLVLEPVR